MLNKILTQAEEIAFLYLGSAWPRLRQEEEHKQHPDYNSLQFSSRQWRSASKKPAAPLPLSSLSHLHFNFWSCQAQLLNISPAKARQCSGRDSCSTEQPQREVIPLNPWSPCHEAPPDAPGGVPAQGGKAGVLGEQSGMPSLGTSMSWFSVNTWTRAMPPLTHSRGSDRQAAIQIQFLGTWKSQGSHPPTQLPPQLPASSQKLDCISPQSRVFCSIRSRPLQGPG